MIPSITDMTSLMLFSAMNIKLIVTVETFPAKSTFWVPLEATLVYGTRIVIPKFLMSSQLARREQFMLMSKDLFVLST